MSEVSQEKEAWERDFPGKGNSMCEGLKGRKCDFFEETEEQIQARGRWQRVLERQGCFSINDRSSCRQTQPKRELVNGHISCQTYSGGQIDTP